MEQNDSWMDQYGLDQIEDLQKLYYSLFSRSEKDETGYEYLDTPDSDNSSK